ncbi:MAG: permease prefix domain 1-containing protein [Eubacterium sp.]
MDKSEYINKVLEHIGNKAFHNEIKNELENHISDREEYYSEIGYDAKTSAQKAIEHMGNADTVGEKLNLLHDYKKHKIISVAGLILFVFSLLFIILTDRFLYLIFPERVLTAVTLIISVVTAYTVYRFAFVSRGCIVVFLHGLVSFGAAVYLTEGFNFTWISNASLDNAFDFLTSITGIIMAVHSIICLTCSGELRALIKGKANNAIINRYKSYERFLLVFTIAFILITIALSVYSAVL